MLRICYRHLLLLCYNYRRYASTAFVVMLPCYRRCTSATSVAMLLLPLLRYRHLRYHCCASAATSNAMLPCYCCCYAIATSHCCYAIATSHCCYTIATSHCCYAISTSHVAVTLSPPATAVTLLPPLMMATLLKL